MVRNSGWKKPAIRPCREDRTSPIRPARPASAVGSRARVCQLEVGGLEAIDRWVAARRNSVERRLDRLGDFLASESKENK